jgi:hypothetical protein
MTMASARWMFEETTGQARLGQYVNTLLLRLKVKLFFRPYRSFLRRWVAR